MCLATLGVLQTLSRRLSDTPYQNSRGRSAKNRSALAKGLASGQVRLGLTWVWLEGKPFCDGSMGSRLGLELVMRSFLWRFCWHLNRDLNIAVLNIQLILVIYSSYVPVKSPRMLN